MPEWYLLAISISTYTAELDIAACRTRGNGKNVVQVEKGKYNITEGFVAAVCDSFGIVHHGIKQFIRRAVLYATSRVSYERHVLARA